jgi:hypothetical protein
MNATVSGNTFSRNGYAAIGNYYGPGWQNSTFDGNTSTTTPSFIHFVEPGNVTAVTFQDNRVTNNIIRDPVPLAPVYGGKNASPVVIDYLGPAMRNVSGNVIQGNDMGRELAPILLPATGFIDGGGNICLAGASNTLACLASSSRLFRHP